MAKKNLLLIPMKIRKTMVLDQNSEAMEDLAKKYQTTLGICGFVTCAASVYLSKNGFDPTNIKSINEQSLTPFIEEAMKAILTRRRLEIKKFKILTDHERKRYLSEYVANYEIADYLENLIDDLPNKQIFFFRQSAYDHPQLVKDLTYEEAFRTETEEPPFKGHQFFYSSFGPYKNHFKEEFEEVLRNCDKKKPVIVAADILGHYYTVVLWEGQIYILDSLDPYMNNRADSNIVECIEYLYKQSYLVKPADKDEY
jgi:hypothetical protein